MGRVEGVKNIVQGFVGKDAYVGLAVLLPAVASVSSFPNGVVGDVLNGVLPLVKSVAGEMPASPVGAVATMFVSEKILRLEELLEFDGSIKDGIIATALVGFDAAIASSAGAVLVDTIHRITNSSEGLGTINVIASIWAARMLGKIFKSRYSQFTGKEFEWSKLLSDWSMLVPKLDISVQKATSLIAAASVIGSGVLGNMAQVKLDVENWLANPPVGATLNLSTQDLAQIRGTGNSTIAFSADAVSRSADPNAAISSAKQNATDLKEKAVVVQKQVDKAIPQVLDFGQQNGGPILTQAVKVSAQVGNFFANWIRPASEQVTLVTEIPDALKSRASRISGEVVKAQSNLDAQVEIEPTEVPEKPKPTAVERTSSAETELTQCEIAGRPYDYIVQPGDVLSGAAQTFFNIEGKLNLAQYFGDIAPIASPDGIVDVYDGAQALCNAQDNKLDCTNVPAGTVIHVPCPTK